MISSSLSKSQIRDAPRVFTSLGTTTKENELYFSIIAASFARLSERL